jgi:hypothetical protein
MFLLCFACCIESIGMLFVKIGRTDEKLFKGILFNENSLLVSIVRNYENFDVLILFPLLRWIDQYTVCENQLNGWQVIWGYFSLKFPSCSVEWILEKFWSFYVFPFVELNRSVYCLWKSVHWLKSYFGGIFHRKIARRSPCVKFGTFWLSHIFRLSS